MRSSLVRAVALFAVPSFIACGGTVVFEEPGEGGGGGRPAGSGGTGATDAVAPSASSAGGESSTDVSISAVSVTSGPGGGDGGAPSGPVGPGPGPGPGGGENPSGGGAPPGPGGVGGADVGGVAVGTVSGGGPCTVAQQSTNQYCYAAETCPDVRLELECETNGDGPWTCWCYQDGQYQGSCNEVDAPSCSPDGCCESYWVFPG